MVVTKSSRPVDLGLAAEVDAQPGDGLLERQLGTEEDAVGVLDAGQLVLGEAVALQADDVEADQLGPVALGNAVGGNVHHHHCPTGNEGVRTDAGELVHGGQPAQGDEVAHLHVPGQRRAVGEDAAVAHLAVVGNVAVGHEEVVVPNPGDAARRRRCRCVGW